MKDKIGWGIIGAGDIARVFAKALQFLPDARLVAIGASSKEKAEKFGEANNVPKRYGSYEELVNDPEVDVVYVATIHPLHKSNCLLALNAGKAVLCEKPFAMNARETEEVIKVARQKKLFLLEAMWTRFTPATAKVREWIASGAIGDVLQMHAVCGFRSGFNPAGRDQDINLGGGALLDMGCYSIAYAYMACGGAPKRVVSAAHIGRTNVDDQWMGVMSYDNGVIATVGSAIQCSLVTEARIYGTEGQIHVPRFWCGQQASLKIGRKPEEVVDLKFEGNGYNYEAAETMRCMREGKLESPLMPLDETLSIMKTMDGMRKDWGLRYPME